MENVSSYTFMCRPCEKDALEPISVSSMMVVTDCGNKAANYRCNAWEGPV